MKVTPCRLGAASIAGILSSVVFSCTVAFEGEVSSLNAKCDLETSKRCGFECVRKDDPTTGCADEDTCYPCVVAHGFATCGENGKCKIQGCVGPWGDCDGDQDNGCETNIYTTQLHCGNCNIPACEEDLPNVELHACLAKEKATAPDQKNCGIARCKVGYGDCLKEAAGCEQDLREDPKNCGQCGNVCSASEVCRIGVCTPRTTSIEAP